MTSGLPAPNIDRRERAPSKRVSGPARRITPLRLDAQPVYDVRTKRELAHRRLVLSLARRLGRLISLHLLDSVAVVFSTSLAGWLSGAPARETSPALIAFVLIGLNLCGAYQAGPSRRDPQRLVLGVLIAAALALVPGTLPSDLEVSHEFVMTFTLATWAALILERYTVEVLVRQAYKRGLGLRRVLIISRAQEASELMDGLRPLRHDFTDDEAEDQVVVGYLTPEDTRDQASLGTIARLEEILDAQNISELLLATSLREAAVSRIADACFARGVRLFVIPPATHHIDGWAELTRVGRFPAYHLHPARLELPAMLLKRATDLVLASVAIVALTPAMVAIAVAIKLETRGPVFFRQRRVGLGGRGFMMWKFRSMRHEAESEREAIAHLNPYADGRLFKLENDPRVTATGRFLRRFSLDELPQLFNILAGDMSLVGPRPPLPGEVDAYEARHFVRLSVVPGLTGPWQVNGRNLIKDFEEVVRLERAYIEGWSLRSDLEIMLRTLGVVLSGKGAY